MERMQTHVKVLAILRIVFGTLGILIGLGIFLVFGGVSHLVQMDNDPDAEFVAPMMGLIGGFVLVALLLLSIPGIIAGIGLMSYQPWARIITIVVSIFDLLNIPFGTALGIYGLWVLFNEDGARLFRQGQLATAQLQR